MVAVKRKINYSSKLAESDFGFLIKSALYLILGSVWITFADKRIIPIGVIVGFLLTKVEALRINRKIEYALLVVGAFFGLFGLGIYLKF